jgi:hypothetical protein
VGLSDLVYGLRKRAELKDRLAQMEPDVGARVRYMRDIARYMPPVESAVMRELPKAAAAGAYAAWGSLALPVLERAIAAFESSVAPDEECDLVREQMLVSLMSYELTARRWIDGDIAGGREEAESGAELWEMAIDDLQELAH